MRWRCARVCVTRRQPAGKAHSRKMSFSVDLKCLQKLAVGAEDLGPGHHRAEKVLDERLRTGAKMGCKVGPRRRPRGCVWCARVERDDAGAMPRMRAKEGGRREARRARERPRRACAPHAMIMGKWSSKSGARAACGGDLDTAWRSSRGSRKSSDVSGARPAGRRRGRAPPWQGGRAEGGAWDNSRSTPAQCGPSQVKSPAVVSITAPL